MTQAPPAPVDTEAAQELLKEATRLASGDELERVGADLERKVALFTERLAPEALPALDADRLRELAGMVFTLRSRRNKVVADRSLADHREAIGDLLHGEAPLAARFDRFTSSYASLGPRRARAFASELLHFTQPGRFWLWTPWIWDPSTGAGALPLVTHDADLGGATAGDTYLRVGRATALVAQDGRHAGYTRLGRGLLGTDVFLATVQAVSMFTLYKLRISQEFLRFLPELPEFVRRLLGVLHLEEVA